MGLLSTGLLGGSAGSSDLFLPAKALVAGKGTMLLAGVFSFLVGSYLRGLQSFSLHGVEPIKGVVVLPAVVRTIIADFLQMALAKESICDLDGCNRHDFITKEDGCVEGSRP